MLLEKKEYYPHKTPPKALVGKKAAETQTYEYRHD